MRCIGNNRERVIEGQLRGRELSSYLEKHGTEKVVWVAEDATVITQKVHYDVSTDTLVGLVSPIDKKTGCPILFYYKASTADEIIENMKKEKATSVYLIMAQPLDEKIPPFVLALFGMNSSLTSRDVINRWKYIKTELKRYGITVAGVSSDGDPRLLSAMCHNMLFDNEISVVQDSIHIGTKIRNRINNVQELPMGKCKVSVKDLKCLLKVDKSIHGLCLSDISPVDRQNFDSFEKITSDRVLNALSTYVPNSEATIKYLQLGRDVVSSYRDFNLKPSERIEVMWRSVYFYRIWREFIKTTPKYTLKDKFITSNTYSCIEVNARNLLSMIRQFRDENRSHHFLPTLFQSQTCEKTFRQLRAMGTTNFTRINFSVLEVLYMIGRIEAQNEILHFKLNNTGVTIPKLEVEKRKTKIFALPSEEEIANALNRAKSHAISEANKFGMSLDETILENYALPYKRHIDTETDAETDFESDIEDGYMNNESDEELNSYFGSERNQSNFEEMREFVGDNEDKPFVDFVGENGAVQKIRKSSLVWVLSDSNFRISSDRLKRVQSMCKRPPRKKARISSEN